MILSFINIRKVSRELLNTSGFALDFQHLPRDLANVNEWKIMFDPYIHKKFSLKIRVSSALFDLKSWLNGYDIYNPEVLTGHLFFFLLFFFKAKKSHNYFCIPR